MKNKIKSLLLATIILASSTFGIQTINAEQTQTMDVFYTERQAINEYEVVIPATLNINENENIEIKLNDNFILEPDYSVYVDLDSSSFNGVMENNILLYPCDLGITENFAAIKVRRMCDEIDLHKSGETFPDENLTAAILHSDSELDFGGELMFMVDEENSRLNRIGTVYSGSISFIIHGEYE